MEIDPEKYKRLLVHLLENLRMMEVEALALRTMYAAAQGWNTPEAVSANSADWETAMETIRNHPNVRGQIAKKYDPLIQTVKNTVDSAVSQQALAEFLKSWKTAGRNELMAEPSDARTQPAIVRERKSRKGGAPDKLQFRVIISSHMSNKIDFSFAKLISGQSQFLAVGSPNTPEFKAAQLLELLEFVIHWRDIIQINERTMLVEDDVKAAELKQKLIAAGFLVEPLKVAGHGR